jgi:Z1 domain
MTTPYEQARTITQALLKGDTPPFTTDLIRQRAMTASTLLKLEPGQIDTLVKELEASFNVWIGVQNILDGDDDHKGWLGGRRGEIKWRYWDRFQRLLEEEQGWPRETVERLAEMTDAVLERLEDPRREGAWDRRGLVAGHVQSGKTANYTGLVCKAADAGYKLIIVLAGIHSSLRSQTQLRLDEGFLGYDSRQSYPNDSRKVIGVGKLDPGCLAPDTVTTSLENGDFNSNFAKQLNINPGGRPLLFVVKKNASVLKNLLGWVQRSTQQRDALGRPLVIGLPLLMIDDEADYASVDTKAIPLDEDGQPDLDHDPTKINGLIRSLLRTFNQSAYVGYTATPFANIFIHEGAETRDEGPDLFPRSFIINLPAPSNYVGPVRVFGLDPDPDAGFGGSPGLPIIRTDEVMKDYPAWMPDGHKKEHVPGPLTKSLKEAIRAFILVCTARLARGQTAAHNSMLVHVTRFTAVQEKVAALVREEVKAIEQRLKRGDGSAPNKVVDELRVLWEKDFEPTTAKIDDPDLPAMQWKQVEPHLYAAVARIKVRTVNGSAGDVLDYVDNRADGLSVIAVGGDKLSRGLTLEGLSVSYYLRASRMYDTLMQMGRWFGYRPGYMDLCRLYTTDDLIRWYRHITAASEELRSLFDHMASIGSTPKDFGFRVKSHPDGLLITAAVKMRNSTELELSFAGSISETVVFQTTDVVSKNYQAAERFIRDLGEVDEVVPRTSKLKWVNVPASKIVDGFLTGITTPEEEVVKVRPELLRSYIQKLVAVGELETWTVVLVGTPDGTPHTIAGHKIRLVERSPLEDSATKAGLYRIRRVLSPPDEGLDLTPDQLAEALTLTQAAWKPDSGRSQRKTPPDSPSGTMMRQVRPPKTGLLIIYPLDTAKTKTDLPLIGFAFSFPQSDNAQKVTYRVTNLYWQQEYGGQ